MAESTCAPMAGCLEGLGAVRFLLIKQRVGIVPAASPPLSHRSIAAGGQHPPTAIAKEVIYEALR